MYRNADNSDSFRCNPWLEISGFNCNDSWNIICFYWLLQSNSEDFVRYVWLAYSQKLKWFRQINSIHRFSHVRYKKLCSSNTNFVKSHSKVDELLPVTHFLDRLVMSCWWLIFSLYLSASNFVLTSYFEQFLSSSHLVTLFDQLNCQTENVCLQIDDVRFRSLCQLWRPKL